MQENPKYASVAPMFVDGPKVIAVSDGVVSATVIWREAGVASKFTMSNATAENTYVCSSITSNDCGESQLKYCVPWANVPNEH